MTEQEEISEACKAGFSKTLYFRLWDQFLKAATDGLSKNEIIAQTEHVLNDFRDGWETKKEKINVAVPQESS